MKDTILLNLCGVEAARIVETILTVPNIDFPPV